MTPPLTKRQVEVLDVIAALTLEHRYAPTFKEIADALGLHSLGTVAKHIATLEANGYIVRDAKTSYRNVQVVPEPQSSLASCANGHPVCWFLGACPACGMRGAA